MWNHFLFFSLATSLSWYYFLTILIFSNNVRKQWWPSFLFFSLVSSPSWYFYFLHLYVLIFYEKLRRLKITFLIKSCKLFTTCFLAIFQEEQFNPFDVFDICAWNLQIIIKMAAANGVKSVWVGQNGLLSTPAVSAVIRERVGKDASFYPSTISLICFFFFFDTYSRVQCFLKSQYCFLLNRDLRQRVVLFWQQVTIQVALMRYFFYCLLTWSDWPWNIHYIYI